MVLNMLLIGMEAVKVVSLAAWQGDHEEVPHWLSRTRAVIDRKLQPASLDGPFIALTLVSLVASQAIGNHFFPKSKLTSDEDREKIN